MKLVIALSFAAGLLPIGANAADCDAIARGKVTLVGSSSTVVLPNLEPKTASLVLVPGPNAKLTQTRPDGGVVEVTYADGHVVATTDVAKGIHLDFVWSDVEGDPHALAEGSSFSFILTVRKDGADQSKEKVTRSVGKHAMRTVSGCLIDTVRFTDHAEGVGNDTTREAAWDYSPTLGIALWSETIFKRNKDASPITIRTMVNDLAPQS